MQQSNRKRVTYSLVLALTLSTCLVRPAFAANNVMDTEPTGGSMVADFFLVRPFMLTASVVGLATFIVTSPLSLLGGNIGESGKKLVLEPAEYTFVRPLGDL
jgi:ABC-type molybdate transport system permease subunit